MVSIEDKKINPNKKIIDDVKIQIIYVPLESSLGYKYKLCRTGMLLGADSSHLLAENSRTGLFSYAPKAF